MLCFLRNEFAMKNIINLNNNIISKGFNYFPVDSERLVFTYVNCTTIRLNLPTLKVWYILPLH